MIAKDKIIGKVIGNSNLRDMAKEFVKRKTTCSVYSYSGASSSNIVNRINHTKSDEEPSHAVIQSGEIDIRDLNVETTAENHIKIINSALSAYWRSKILITNVSNRTPFIPKSLKCRYN